MGLNWLSGRSAEARILDMNSQLRKETQKSFFEFTDIQVNQYSPWICHPKKADLLKPLFTQKSSSILLDSEQRKVLSNVYYCKSEDPASSIRVREEKLRPKENDDYLEAIAFLKDSDDFLKKVFEKIVDVVVPCQFIEGETKTGVGFSSKFARGAIFLSLPTLEKHSRVELSINLAHELGHQILMLYQCYDPIVKTDFQNQKVFSGVRKTDRPAILSFHALIALFYMCYFLDALIYQGSLDSEEQTYTKNRFRTLFSDLLLAIQSFPEDLLTDLGKSLFCECRSFAENMSLIWELSA